MQFKNPEILFFLFALALPILVHLFQLKRFTPQVFTNVAFLKEISLQTRKSSQLKKWLLLVCRLFLITTLILAFAQPYIPNKQQNLSDNKLVIVLDNSLSMQAKGSKGDLLPSAIQEILEVIPQNKTFTLLTNSNTFFDIDVETAINDIQKITYSPIVFQPNSIINKIKTLLPANTYNLLLISDGNFDADSIALASNQNFFYQVKPVNNQNAAIEKVELLEDSNNFNTLEITLKGYNISDSLACTINISDADKLYHKSKIWINNNVNKVTVTLPKQSINGIITLDSNDLDYDNQFYFSLNAPKESAIGIIGKKNPELEKIFPNRTSKITYISSEQDINGFDAILINQETKNLDVLGKKLKEAYNQGAQLIYIPNTNLTTEQHNIFLSHFGALKFANLKSNKNSITTIHFDHPLFRNVFTKKPENFEYPFTHKNFIVNGSVTPILSYSNQEIYVGGISNGLGNLYIFTSSLDSNETNILQSPIIVPTIYNMVFNNQSNQLNNFELLSNNSILVNANTHNLSPVTIKGKTQEGIVQQQPISNKTKLLFTDFPTLPGNYTVLQNKSEIESLSLNYPRTESNLTLSDAILFNNFVQVKSIDEALSQLNKNSFGTELWKYLILTTLLFLILELLIQKFLK